MKKLLFVIFSFSMLVSCKEKQKKITGETSGNLPAGFEAFYKKFHQDSFYQIEHCVFPMEGLPDQADSSLNTAGFRWTPENWRMHKELSDTSSGMKRTWDIISDQMVNERMLNEQQGIGMERRFAKMNDEWYLIYYVGVNQYRKH